MISSQGRLMARDPLRNRLPAGALDAFVASYSAGDRTVAVARQGEALVLSADGQRTSLQAETSDVFFVPGSPRERLIFRRDGPGRVAGLVWRKDEQDLVFTRE